MKQDNLLAYFAATAPALLQLIAVLSIGLVNVLKLNQYVLSPNFINIANLFVVLLSIVLISVSSFWDYNKLSFLREGDNFTTPTRRFWLVLKIATILAVIFVLVFIAIVLYKERLPDPKEVWVVAQWFSYILSLTLISWIIFIYALLKIQEKRNAEAYSSYVPKLVDSLRRYGHIKDPDIVILSIDRNSNKHIVRINRRNIFEVTTDYTGEMTSISQVANPTQRRDELEH